MRRLRHWFALDTVPFTPSPFTARLTRLVVLCLLAIVLPLQGAAVAAFSAMGPAHVHNKPAPAALVLEDLRRWRPAPVAQVHAFTALGHFHAGAAPQRHHHAAGDTSAVRTPADEPDTDEALGASSVSLLAPLPAVLTWGAQPTTTAADASPLWALRTTFSDPLDRPPRRA